MCKCARQFNPSPIHIKGTVQCLFLLELFLFPPWRVNGELLKFKGHSSSVEDQEPIEKGQEGTNPIFYCYVVMCLTIFFILTIPSLINGG